jgi:hypothetical protein
VGDSDDTTTCTTSSSAIVFLGGCRHGVDDSCFVANRNGQKLESTDCRQGKRKNDGDAMTMIGHEFLDYCHFCEAMVVKCIVAAGCIVASLSCTDTAPKDTGLSTASIFFIPVF